MQNILLISILLLLLALAVRAMYRARKRGGSCAGCPYAGSCARKNEGKCLSNDKK